MVYYVRYLTLVLWVFKLVDSRLNLPRSLSARGSSLLASLESWGPALVVLEPVLDEPYPPAVLDP